VAENYKATAKFCAVPVSVVLNAQTSLIQNFNVCIRSIYMVHELFLANSYEGEVLLLYIIFYMQQHDKCIKRIKIVTITLTITPPRQQCHHMLILC
jgi:hypothetical protein